MDPGFDLGGACFVNWDGVGGRKSIESVEGLSKSQLIASEVSEENIEKNKRFRHKKS